MPSSFSHFKLFSSQSVLLFQRKLMSRQWQATQKQLSDSFVCLLIILLIISWSHVKAQQIVLYPFLRCAISKRSEFLEVGSKINNFSVFFRPHCYSWSRKTNNHATRIKKQQKNVQTFRTGISKYYAKHSCSCRFETFHGIKRELNI